MIIYSKGGGGGGGGSAEPWWNILLYSITPNSYSGRIMEKWMGLTNSRNGTGRNGQIPGPIPRNGPSKFKGHKSHFGIKARYFGISLRFAGAASRMVEETLCNRADDGCKGWL